MSLERRKEEFHMTDQAGDGRAKSSPGFPMRAQRITGWFGVEGTFRGHPVWPPCSGQGGLQWEQVAQSSVQADPEVPHRGYTAGKLNSHSTEEHSHTPLEGWGWNLSQRTSEYASVRMGRRKSSVENEATQESSTYSWSQESNMSPGPLLWNKGNLKEILNAEIS